MALFFRQVVVFLSVYTALIPIAACTIDLTPASTTVHVNEVVTFQVKRTVTHMDCVVPIEDTTIVVDGGVVTDPGAWKTGDVDTLTFAVKFTRLGAASVTLNRGCPLLPEVPTSNITVKEQAPPPPTPATPAPVKPKPTASKPVATETPAPATPVVAPPPTAPPPTVTVAPTPVPTPVQAPVTQPRRQVIRTPEMTPFTAIGVTQPYSFTWISPLARFTRTLGLWMVAMLLGVVLYLLRARTLRTAWLLTSLVVLGFFLRGCPCSIGAIFWALSGAVSLLLLVPVALSLLWGRVFCGWVCPAGAAQELLHGRGTQTTTIPARLDRTLKWGKYLVLIGFGVTVFAGHPYLWGVMEPFRALFNFGGTTVALIALVAVLATSVFTSRTFCRYLCPMGAVLALSARFSRTKVTPCPADRCSGCGRCHLVGCPTGALTLDANRQPLIDQSECIRCNKCSDGCPRQK